MSFADVESEGERVPLELFSAQKLRKATDELSLWPTFPHFVIQLLGPGLEFLTGISNTIQGLTLTHALLFMLFCFLPIHGR